MPRGMLTVTAPAFHMVDVAAYTLEQLTARPGFAVCLSCAALLLAVKIASMARVRIVSRDTRRPLL